MTSEWRHSNSCCNGTRRPCLVDDKTDLSSLRPLTDTDCQWHDSSQYMDSCTAVLRAASCVWCGQLERQQQQSQQQARQSASGLTASNDWTDECTVCATNDADTVSQLRLTALSYHSDLAFHANHIQHRPPTQGVRHSVFHHGWWMQRPLELLTLMSCQYDLPVW